MDVSTLPKDDISTLHGSGIIFVLTAVNSPIRIHFSIYILLEAVGFGQCFRGSVARSQAAELDAGDAVSSIAVSANYWATQSHLYPQDAYYKAGINRYICPEDAFAESSRSGRIRR